MVKNKYLKRHKKQIKVVYDFRTVNALDFLKMEVAFSETRD